ncbi:hypothetical protein SARC_04069 [Sphaeroforma arctica JP610]|uniref:Histone-lysine N-methyltransferase, H3 lysine-79 specific n=1 Tax=Sphaeroforma arctica JP610 TaxID=667725 RepID=A0A0L0G4C8_9EUKA|nr:hypothetical protein SARC_04069 [Sphaeroforma arctica JP610]KNC83671.1 hypothetical protein SARC_04069 [Sphaeroforma arctica JP610]|eukprot:XP_014157573.1 hypothetical protein SARC_04069 [Sphaeroforma arctica JP610]
MPLILLRNTPQDLVSRYNAAIASVMTFEGGDSKAPALTTANVPLVKLVMRQVYNVIDDPKKLNNYKSFSEEVYGEFNFNIVKDIIEKAPITSDDVFIDLGSGVGQIVLQTSAQCQCKYSYGIEKRDIPHDYAMIMEKAYVQKMKWFGKSYGPFELHQGDFLDPKWVPVIQKCTVVFCNNYTFQPDLNHALKEIFVDLKHGTRIISSASFMPLNFRISDRNTNDIGCIMNVRKVTFTGEGVSWTDKPLDYFIHTIDKTKLDRYFMDKKIREAQAAAMESGSSSENNTSDEEFMPNLAADKARHHGHQTIAESRSASRRRMEYDDTSSSEDSQSEYDSTSSDEPQKSSVKKKPAARRGRPPANQNAEKIRAANNIASTNRIASKSAAMSRLASQNASRTGSPHVRSISPATSRKTDRDAKDIEQPREKRDKSGIRNEPNRSTSTHTNTTGSGTGAGNSSTNRNDRPKGDTSRDPSRPRDTDRDRNRDTRDKHPKKPHRATKDPNDGKGQNPTTTHTHKEPYNVPRPDSRNSANGVPQISRELPALTVTRTDSATSEWAKEEARLDQAEVDVGVDEVVDTFVARQRTQLREFMHSHNPQQRLGRLEKENTRLRSQLKRTLAEVQATTAKLTGEYRELSGLAANGVATPGPVNGLLDNDLANANEHGSDEGAAEEAASALLLREQRLLREIKQLHLNTTVVDETQRQKLLVKDLKVLCRFAGLKIQKWKERFEFTHNDPVKLNKEIQSFKTDVGKALREMGFQCPTLSTAERTTTQPSDRPSESDKPYKRQTSADVGDRSTATKKARSDG